MVEAPDEGQPKRLRFGYAVTALGTVLVAESATGLATLLLGNDRERLRADLDRAFPGAELVEDQVGLRDTLAEAARLVAAPADGSTLPLDLGGFALERAVWDALRAIPAGETRSYGQVARMLSVPATAQEVAAACAANVVAVAVPCHRVVKADGSISGYRWGVARKRKLLQLEKTR